MKSWKLLFASFGNSISRTNFSSRKSMVDCFNAISDQICIEIPFSVRAGGCGHESWLLDHEMHHNDDWKDHDKDLERSSTLNPRFKMRKVLLTCCLFHTNTQQQKGVFWFSDHFFQLLNVSNVYHPQCCLWYSIEFLMKISFEETSIHPI